MHTRRAGISAGPFHVHIYFAFEDFFVFFVASLVVFFVFLGPHVPHPIITLLPG